MRKPLLIIICAIVAIHAFKSVNDCKFDKSQPQTESTDLFEVALSDCEGLWIDTIICADGHTFGYSGDVSGWDGWYFDTVFLGEIIK